MRIALFSDVFLPAKNGVVTHVSELLNGLRRNGHAVFLVTAQYPGYTDDDNGVLRLLSMKVPLGKGMEIRYAFGRQRTANDFLRDKRIDIVHTHSEFALGVCGKKVARQFGIPHVHTMHTMWEDYRHYIFSGKLLTKGMVRRTVRHFLKGVDRCIAPSLKSANYLSMVMPAMPVSIISNGVDTERVASLLPSPENRQELRAQLGIRENNLVLIFVGRIALEKRVYELLDTVSAAAVREPRIRMIFVGDGPALEPLKQRARESQAPQAFIFTGFLPWESVIRMYACANLFVTLSLSEVHPMTLLEAQVCGLPAIVRRDESYLGTIEDGVNGYLLEEDLQGVERILKLVRDPGELALASRQSLEKAAGFSIEKTILRMEQFYEKLIGS